MGGRAAGDGGSPPCSTPDTNSIKDKMMKRSLIDINEFPPVTIPLARFRAALARMSQAFDRGRLADAEQERLRAADAAMECASALCDFLGRPGR